MPVNAQNERSEAARAQAQERLEATKLKVCQKKEAAIQKRSEQLVKMATNMQTKFTAIASRVKEYYADNVVGTDAELDNYDALLTTISDKQTAVNESLTKAQAEITEFTCDSGDPKAHLTNFKENMKATKAALKEYRTAIKDLIVAIRTAVAEDDSTDDDTSDDDSTTDDTTGGTNE